MDLEPRLQSGTSPPSKRNRRSTIRLALAALGVLLTSTILFIVFTASPDPDVVWLTQAEMIQPKHTGPLTQLKHKFMNLTAPLWRRYWSSQPQILIDSSLLTIPTATVVETELGAPVATNIDGMYAWILSPTNVNALRQRLTAIPGASVVSRPRVQTANGTQGRMFAGGSTPSNNAPVGVAFDALPKIVAGSIKLTIGFTSTELLASPSTNAGAVGTNLAVSCRVLLPNNGGLVVGDCNRKDASGKGYWLIISPTVVDARGNPIRL